MTLWRALVWWALGLTVKLLLIAPLALIAQKKVDPQGWIAWFLAQTGFNLTDFSLLLGAAAIWLAIIATNGKNRLGERPPLPRIPWFDENDD